MFQSTHPHGVRLKCCIVCTLHYTVSIHAPTRGATLYHLLLHFRNHVSIHAPTRGATSEKDFTKCDTVFQSTHPHGVRHSPCISYNTLIKFQSTHPHGVRQLTTCYYSESMCFNPRTHTGCDWAFINTKFTEISFNPRTHTGCDVRDDIDTANVYVSIHAPTRGATPSESTPYTCK